MIGQILRNVRCSVATLFRHDQAGGTRVKTYAQNPYFFVHGESFFIQGAPGHRLRVGDTDDVTRIYHGNLLTGQDICLAEVEGTSSEAHRPDADPACRRLHSRWNGQAARAAVHHPSQSNPIGAFFEAMYQTGVFWNFMGVAQVVAGVLLLVPGLAHLGAFAFLPIMVCIVAIVMGVGFGAGTTLVTVLMLMAVLYLLAWDYDRFRSLLTTRPFPAGDEIAALTLDRWERVGFAVVATALLTFFGFTRNFVAAELARLAIWVGLTAGVFTLLRFVVISIRLGRGKDNSNVM